MDINDNASVFSLASSATIRRLTYVALSLSLCAGLEVSSASAEEEVTSRDITRAISLHGVTGTLTLPKVTLIAPDRDLADLEQQAEVRAEVSEQLRYLVGNLNGLEGGLELHRAEMNDLEKVELLDDESALYRYSAEINAVVKSSESAPSEVTQIRGYLPARVDPQGLEAVFSTYGADCVPNSLRSYDPEVYWYDFRPNAFYCPLAGAAGGADLKHVVAVDMTLRAAPEIDTPLYPRYREFWRDGRLVVTAVYALVGGLLAEQGQEGYQMVFEEMVRTYGEPTSMNRPELLNDDHLDTDTPVIHATFETPRGPLELHLFLINSLETPSHVEGDDLSQFVEEYNELSSVSDFMIYNGHAHHGADNARLDELGIFAPRKHQLFFVNTCASYTYGLPQVQRRVLDLNRGEESPHEYLDMVVNAMPAMGHEIAYMNQRYIKALVSAEESYQSILADMYAQQQMLVLYADSKARSAELDKGDFDPSRAADLPEPVVGSSAPMSINAQSGCDATLQSRRTTPFWLILICLLVGGLKRGSRPSERATNDQDRSK